MDDNRPPAYMEEGKVIYRASSVGRCQRALVAARRGYAPLNPPEDIEQAGQEGRLHEGDIVDRLGEWTVRDREMLVEYPIADFIYIRGHIDGIAERTDEVRLLEMKSMSVNRFKDWQRHGFDGFPGYAAQLSVYMKATQLDQALYAVKNRNTGELDLTLVEVPPADMSLIAERLLAVEDQVRKLEDHEWPECDRQDWPCPFFYLHDEKEEVEKADASLELAVMLEAERRLYFSIARMSDERRELRRRIKQLVGIGDSYQAGDIKVVRYKARREHLDRAALEKDFGTDTILNYVEEKFIDTLKITGR